MARLIHMFLDQLSERLPRLENARARGDLEAVERIAHSLKGSAATVGATRVSELCSGICERARAGDPDEPLEAALVEASGQTSAAMRRYAEELATPA